MPSPRALLRRLSDAAFGTAFDRAIDRARREPGEGFLFAWNRGLGDVALGMAPLFQRIRAEAPGARITVLTREDLADAFSLTRPDRILAVPGLSRGASLDLAAACRNLRLDAARFAAAFAAPDPTRWLAGRRHLHAPALAWNAAWDALADPLVPASGGVTLAAHVSSETARHYGYTKDWAPERWRELFAAFPGESGVRWLLLGLGAADEFQGENLVDLRGRTPFPALMAAIRRCSVLVAPDSGILTMTYYVADPHALALVSLWADPRQGILKQGSPSPNPRLSHEALRAPGGDLGRLEVGTVRDAVSRALASMR